MLSACGDKPGGDRKEVFPVTGEAVVDGKPAAGVQVQLHDVNGMDKQMPTMSAGVTDEQGKFQISTYDQNDGAPAGDYVATFAWSELNLISRDQGPDKLKKKYSNPKTSTFKVKVESGKGATMDRVELSTK
jgi:hypothetical protein